MRYGAHHRRVKEYDWDDVTKRLKKKSAPQLNPRSRKPLRKRKKRNGKKLAIRSKKKLERSCKNRWKSSTTLKIISGS